MNIIKLQAKVSCDKLYSLIVSDTVVFEKYLDLDRRTSFARFLSFRGIFCNRFT